MQIGTYPYIPVEVDVRGGKGVSTFIQDQKSRSLSLPFLQDRSLATLASDTVIDSNVISLVAGHTTVVGEIIEIIDNISGEFMQAKIIAISGDDLTMDAPVSCVVPAGDEVIISSKEMNVDGSATPQIFSVKPLPTQSGDITRVTFHMDDILSMDGSTFGGQDELVNGCVLRVKHSDGCYQNIFNFKSNGSIRMECFDTAYTDANKRGLYGFSARLTWGGQNKHGVVIPLDGSLGEELQLVIQDDLTGLSQFRMKAQGHVSQ